jgi:small subunit ribosomal protein S9
VSKPLAQTTGRRKRAIARVCIRSGSGKVVINGRALNDYLPTDVLRNTAVEAMRVTESIERYDIDVTMNGGGIAGQAGAIRMGIARAICEVDPEQRPTLKKAGLLTRDAREKESKKYGLKKARKAPQYSKR